MNDVLRYYEGFSYRAPLRFFWETLSSKGNAKRQSALNRLLDYLALRESPDRIALHRKLNTIARRQTERWPSHDYGEGYFYQSLSRVGVRGLRATEERVDELGLKSRVAGRTVLEIGCNSGFLSLSIAETAKQVEAFDLNPYLIEMAEACREHLGVKNVRFTATSFEDWKGPGGWGAILSFANHSTFDGNTQNTVDEFFARCRSLLAPDGVFLFESHHPSFETPEKVAKVLEALGRHFVYEPPRKTIRGTYFDRGRTFTAATPRP